MKAYSRSPGDLLLAVIGVAALTALAVADPSASTLFPPCLWRAATGWLCPGCGSARAIHALLHGHPGVALHTNPLAVAAVPLGTVDVIRRLRGNESPLTWRVRPIYLHALVVAIVVFAVVRNLSS